LIPATGKFLHCLNIGCCGHEAWAEGKNLGVTCAKEGDAKVPFERVKYFEITGNKWNGTFPKEVLFYV
jgi:hypothetical protein